MLQKLAHRVIEQASGPMRAGAQGYPLSLDPLPSGHLVALARVVIKVEVSEQGVNTRFVVKRIWNRPAPKCSIGTSTVPVVKWKTRSKTTSST